MRTLSGTILVADDDSDIREILRDTLNSLGAKIVTAVDGQECLARVEADAPDVLLLDIEMPVKNGLQVLQELRQRGSETTVIMITAYGTIERAVHAIKQGAYDFITEPFIAINCVGLLKICWRASFSAMRKAPSPARIGSRRAK